jgi:ribosomal protein S12 methylthiotransferase
MVPDRYWLETLGCPKNQVDSEKLVGLLHAEGFQPASEPGEADLVVVNTCAFIEAARQESVDTLLQLSEARRPGARLVATGCLAERHGEELALALPELDLVAGFGVPVTGGNVTDSVVPVTLGKKGGDIRPGPLETQPLTQFDLLNLPRPAVSAPWAYLKVTEGCDRHCGFCAIPSFRGRQRSRSLDALLGELEDLGSDVREIVLVAQDLASFGMDRSDPDRAPRTAGASRPIVELIRSVSAQVPWVRLLYLYPSALDDDLISAILDTGLPYFDLSLQHVSRPLLERMRRWGEGDRFLERIRVIRSAAPEATFRSSFILGYPGETEEDHDRLLAFLEEAQLDWAGFFTFSEEPGTFAAGLDAAVPEDLALERLRECAELQDAITARRREALVGREFQVLVDSPGIARSHREAPEIDGVITVPENLAVGEFADVVVTGALGPDLEAVPR